MIELDGQMIASEEFAQLLMIFNGSRVHEQGEREHGPDEAPPGTYFTAVNAALIHEGHKNRVGIYLEEAGPALYLEDAPEQVPALGTDVAGAVHVDHFFLRGQAPDWLGTIAFALCAMVAHRMGYRHISLIAAGGDGYDPRMVGYRFWPKVGFDAPVEQHEIAAWPRVSGCRTVQEIIATDEDWWDQNGSQRWMEFSLSAGSPSWRKLIDYLEDKELI
ncbi:hypothetical protein [Cupriavidus consociatus]|uniref:hypothetical protein n=1 Tax=Cupriavidus consociatus TaxID=2821357 RepID=UPI0024DFCEBB|nr:hypothetical protein [Cupriavidus sp. LEh21]MDK2660844.1 hypothetical protein [Cupriavidus sp. LEh21]